MPKESYLHLLQYPMKIAIDKYIIASRPPRSVSASSSSFVLFVLNTIFKKNIAIVLNAKLVKYHNTDKQKEDGN